MWDNGESAIDRSSASSILRPLMTWSVFSSPGDNGHCSINVTFAKRSCDQTVPIKQLNIKRADWRVYSQNSAWGVLLEVDDVNNEEALEDLYSRFNKETDESIPSVLESKYFPKPWWSEELRLSLIKRERAYFKYRGCKSMANLIQWKRIRAEPKQLMLKSKKLEAIYQNLDRKNPSAEVFWKVNKIKGTYKRNIMILFDGGRIYSTVSEIVNKIGETFHQTCSATNYDNSFLYIT